MTLVNPATLLPSFLICFTWCIATLSSLSQITQGDPNLDRVRKRRFLSRKLVSTSPIINRFGFAFQLLTSGIATCFTSSPAAFITLTRSFAPCFEKILLLDDLCLVARVLAAACCRMYWILLRLLNLSTKE